MTTDRPPSPAVDDPLALLEVIDRLEVGPVELTPDRLSAPYRVTQGGRAAETELSYRYEEPVFDPDEPASRNLAALVAAQVALNYGLFCHEIVFHGPLDGVDRAFLGEMAANTAREIYVKKFLTPNPFLSGPAAALPAVRRSSYLRSALVFPDAPPGEADKPIGGTWEAVTGRIGVLASGGKDSLVSHGLLTEMGLETHSVFVNESGRHWYTALNAYRHLKAERPQTTSRVWTSADRVFSWMLRHLPFVRPDFARQRADEYPIRLWTVAVFLFGALPVLRRRGIGRLVIGDEHDTTRRLRYRGIPHYDGLYDQSRSFDQALSRYFSRKSWALAQFSILRQLSELLIEKVLVERYPELLRHQVSCHAASVRGERVYPCGKCEKCRRIVGMLVALGADPGACGYDAEQVRSCLDSLAGRGVHQEAAGVQQLAWMLAERGVLPERTAGMGRARERPEILKLRFDREASPVSGLPMDLRRPLLSLLLEHADGAVEKVGRVWRPFDALSDLALRPVYDGREGPARRSEAGIEPPGAAETAGRRSYLLGEQTWITARERFRETDTALLPVGAIEQHGPHLPLDTDAWDADYLCRVVARRCSDPKPLVLPLISYGVSYHHDDFPGTLSVSPETLSRLVYEVGVAAARHGILKLVIVNGHGGNAPTLQLAAQLINRDAHIFTCVDSGETSDADINGLAETANDIHAGEIETSTSLATRPDLVDTGRLAPAVPVFSSHYLDFSSTRSVEWYAHTAKISGSGVLGDPTRASREKGEKIWELMIEHLVRFVESVKGLSLDEIHARRH